MSLMARIRPVFPDMPTWGRFRIARQPIHAAFAPTLWTVPVRTPHQLALAISRTACCRLAPRPKERRLSARHGDRVHRCRASAPYVVPRLISMKDDRGAQ